MYADHKTIEGIDLFDGLSSEEQDDILAVIYSMRVLEGEQVTREGDPAQNFYIVLSGSFMLHVDDGRALTIRERGGIMGISSVIGPVGHRISVTALTDGAVLVIPGDDLQRLIALHSGLGQKIISRINEDLQIRRVLMDGHEAALFFDTGTSAGGN
jgi:CRP-like cAMP-binding protein